MKQADHISTFEDAFNVFPVLQEERDLPARVGIENIDLQIRRIKVSKGVESILYIKLNHLKKKSY